MGATRARARAHDHIAQYIAACVYATLGEVDRALELLERTMPGASAHRQAWMARDGDFDPTAGSSALRGAPAPPRRGHLTKGHRLEPVAPPEHS